MVSKWCLCFGISALKRLLQKSSSTWQRVKSQITSKAQLTIGRFVKQGVIAKEVPSNVLKLENVIIEISNILGLGNVVAKKPLTELGNARWKHIMGEAGGEGGGGHFKQKRNYYFWVYFGGNFSLISFSILINI
jgi:hypothetical protein